MRRYVSQSAKALILITVIAVSSPPAQAAEAGLNSRTFLTWTEKSRISYIQTSLMMANMIAMDNDKHHAECIGKWYEADRRKTEASIYAVMKKYPDAHPIGVIMAVVEKQCGSFKYK
jgi:hypothetical protein